MKILKKLCIGTVVVLAGTGLIGCKKELDPNVKTLEISHITREEATTYVPNSFHEDLAKEKGLKLFSKEYLQLQAAYLSVMNLYLNETAGLDDFQEKLDNSGYNFIEIEDDEKDVYFRNGSFGRKNIYIRNNIHIEVLSEEDLDILKNAVYSDKVALHEDALEMVKRTMKDVIKVYYENPEDKFDAIYDAGVFQVNEAPNEALVLELKYEFEFDENGNFIGGLEEEKTEYLKTFKEELEKEMSEKLGMPVYLFY